MDLMPCSRCHKKVDSVSTSSCLCGHMEVSEQLEISSDRLKKLCSFDDLFFCPECIEKDICVDCLKVLTAEEANILRKTFGL